MKKFSEENVRQYMWPHLHKQKNNQRSTASHRTDLKHGDVIKSKDGKIISTFRLIENDLYEDEFYRYALPIAKEIWDGGLYNTF